MVRQFLKDEKGATLVIFALIIFVLFGFTALVVDVGALYVERRNMVTAADAAALAGAMELALTKDESEALDVAKNYAEEKNLAESSDAVIVTIEGEKAVQVDVGINKNLIFAKLIGFSNANVGASATAIWGYPTGMSDLLPIFYEDLGGNLPVGEEQVLLAPKLGPGNWGLLDVGKGKRSVNDVFKGEPSGELVLVGEEFLAETETGLAQSSINAIEERMQRAKDPNSGVSMQGFIPIVKFVEDLSGKSDLQIVGFAPFLIHDVITEEFKEKTDDMWYGKGSIHAHLVNAPKSYSTGYEKKQDLSDEYPKGAVIGEFLDTVFIPATNWVGSTQDPSADFGLYMIRLIK